MGGADRLKNATEEQDYVFAYVDGESKIQTVHSLNNLGGTRLCPANKVVGLFGLDQVAMAAELQKNALLVD